MGTLTVPAVAVPATFAGPKARLRGIVYIRVSQEKEEGFSPEQQLWACQQYALAHNIELVGEPVEDLDLSGRDFAKRKITEIIERVRRGEANCVIVWQWSRFGRNNHKSQAYLAELKRAGGELYSATEHFDVTTATGEFSRDQMLLIAAYQSNMIGQNWKENHQRRLRNKLPHTGQPRFGYQRCDDCVRNPDSPRAYLRCSTCHGVLVVDPVRGPALAEAYEMWVLQDIPMDRVAKYMAGKGIRSLKGAEMDAASWYRVLDSGFAAGLLRSRSEPSNPEKGITYATNKPNTYDLWYPGAHFPLITSELWEAYKRKRCPEDYDSELSGFVRETEPKYGLSGLVRCGNIRDNGEICLAIMTASVTKYKSKYGTYHTDIWRCSRYVRSKQCRAISVTRPKAETEVLKWLDANSKHSETGEVAMKRAATAARAGDQAAEVKKEIQRLKEKLDRALEGYLDKIISPEDYLNKKEELEGQLEVRVSRLRLLNSEVAANQTPGADAFGTLLELWPKMEEYEKRAGAKKVISYLLVTPTPGRAPNKLTIVPRWEANQEALAGAGAPVNQEPMVA
ncbi:resolvase [Streptomyces xanthochromogenes]|uniref:recombinase family protein n=1 Tax=Streptomyces xanthochromogenes TaxID=67384 RepID=UPI00167B9852|nr:recombinase family protein [Streptomyces xanthochromogenes]GHB52884.1 resolvase [Streptomyces xanthochromogenes]